MKKLFVVVLVFLGIGCIAESGEDFASSICRHARECGEEGTDEEWSQCVAAYVQMFEIYDATECSTEYRDMMECIRTTSCKELIEENPGKQMPERCIPVSDVFDECTVGLAQN